MPASDYFSQSLRRSLPTKDDGLLVAAEPGAIREEKFGYLYTHKL